MRPIPYDVGRIVLSKQGHDKGRWFAVVGLVDGKHVLIADGKTRKLEKPKKKQCKHLRPRPTRLSEIAALLLEGKPVLDSELRKALKAFADEEEKQTMNACKKKEECALVQE